MVWAPLAMGTVLLGHDIDAFLLHRLIVRAANSRYTRTSFLEHISIERADTAEAEHEYVGSLRRHGPSSMERFE